MRDEEVLVALEGARQRGDPDADDDEQHEKRRHENLVDALDAARHAEDHDDERHNQAEQVESRVAEARRDGSEERPDVSLGGQLPSKEATR